jgi:hypothetical protein
VKLDALVASHLESLWRNGTEEDGSSGVPNLSDQCIYTIRHSDELLAAYSQGGSSTWTENKRWTQAQRLLEEGQGDVPIVFAPAEGTRRLFAWALLDRVKARSSTEYSFSAMRFFPEGRRPLKTSLHKAHGGQPLSADFIRPYAICITPDYLRKAAAEPVAEGPAGMVSKRWARRDLENLTETDRQRMIVGRCEQQLLRRLVVGRSQAYTCQMCNRELPVDLLVAAHIKPRSACDEEERRDPKNVIALCKLGCDDLFERGYIVVEAGKVVEGRKAKTLAVREYVAALSGQDCPAWDLSRKAYFGWRSAIAVHGE